MRLPVRQRFWLGDGILWVEAVVLLLCAVLVEGAWVLFFLALPLFVIAWLAVGFPRGAGVAAMVPGGLGLLPALVNDSLAGRLVWLGIAIPLLVAGWLIFQSRYRPS